MTKRKRTDEEQKAWDELETMRAQRKEVVGERDMALSLLDQCETDATLDDEDVKNRALHYISCRKLVTSFDSEFATKKAAYDAMRAAGDTKP